MSKTTISENLYLVAPSAILDIPLPLTTWEKSETDPVEYYSINDYVANYGHTVKQFSADGMMFAKGFNWTVDKIDEVREKSAEFGLEYGVSLLILNHNQLIELLASDAWKAEGEDG